MVRTITIDTLTELQTNQYMIDKSKPSFDKWKDYGKDIYSFVLSLQNRGFEIIMILGEPGTGKSSGMRTLPHDTNIWFNADNKNPVWEGGKEEYGRKNTPRAPFHLIPKNYSDILTHIDVGISKEMFAEERFAFMTGHTETFKKGNDVLERLKTLGNLANKQGIENKMETVLYSRVEVIDGKPNFILETQNSGFNTARSHQGMFEPKIPNDYGIIIEKLLNY